MREFWKNVLVTVLVGFVASILVMIWYGVFQAESLKDLFRLISDGFFIVAALMLCYGGLVWTYNGGVMDGLGYSIKTLISRVSPGYEDNKVSFAEYREQREKKTRSPKATIVAGLILMVPACISFAVYYLL